MYKQDIELDSAQFLVDGYSEISRTCNQCNQCKNECDFLQTYGNPLEIVEIYQTDPKHARAISFECSLCGLCSAVCTQQLHPDDMFYQFRKEAVDKSEGSFKEHQGLLNYQNKGTSKKYSYYSLPADCHTVFFPGCSLPGTRPDNTLKTYQYLQEQIDNIGIVLDCCTKPSHDLGQTEYFHSMFSELKLYLLQNQVQTIIVACPNCHKIVRTYGQEFEIKTVYDVMANNGFDKNENESGNVVLHDPCPVRFETGIHESVRSIIEAKGLTVTQTPHSKEKTYCCGEGGAVGCMAPDLAQSWTHKRASESSSSKIATYCAGCVNMLSKKAESFHVLDLVFEPEKTISGKAKVAKAPFTYLNRLKLKKQLKKLPAKTTRERSFTAQQPQQNSILSKILFFIFLLSAIAGINVFGVHEYFDQEQLSQIISQNESLAPIIYILVYTIAPVLFLPGLPITIVGGILFGPFWGVVYTMIGSTAGAGMAFLISRYIASDFIQSRLNGPKWIRLQNNVEDHGWKVVAMARLIPVLPFNLLNYAFGLTRVKFTHYIIATFIFMLPACIAFIVFSSSLIDVIQGRLTIELIAGIVLIILVSFTPFIYKKINMRTEKL